MSVRMYVSLSWVFLCPKWSVPSHCCVAGVEWPFPSSPPSATLPPLAQCESDLAEAIPALEAAEAALNTLKVDEAH